MRYLYENCCMPIAHKRKRRNFTFKLQNANEAEPPPSNLQC